jgi:YHS domain-containing protein
MQIDEKSAAGSVVHGGERYYFCSENCLRKFQTNPSAYARTASANASAPAAHQHVHGAGGHAAILDAPSMAPPMPAKKPGKDMAKDPICGMVVDKATAPKTERGGRTYYFCSVGCQRTLSGTAIVSYLVCIGERRKSCVGGSTLLHLYCCGSCRSPSCSYARAAKQRQRMTSGIGE